MRADPSPLTGDLRGETNTTPTPPTLQPGTNPKLSPAPLPHRAWKSKQFREKGGGCREQIQQLLRTGEEHFIHPPSPPGLKQSVQDLSLKINWRCLSGCVYMGLFLELSFTASGPLSPGGWAGWESISPQALPLPFQAWGSCQ